MTTWSVVGLCAWLARRRARRVLRLEAPSATSLKEELERERLLPDEDRTSDAARRKLVAGFNERLLDVELELALVTPTVSALTRVAVGATCFCTLLAAIWRAELSVLGRAGWVVAIAASGGVGTALSAHFGRQAKARATLLKEAWNRASRKLL